MMCSRTNSHCSSRSQRCDVCFSFDAVIERIYSENAYIVAMIGLRAGVWFEVVMKCGGRLEDCSYCYRNGVEVRREKI